MTASREKPDHLEPTAGPCLPNPHGGVARVERIGDATLYLGDCRDILPTLQGVAAIVTDPPYGIGYAHSGFHDGSIGITKAANKRGAPKVTGDDTPFDPVHLLGFKRVLMWGADHFYPRLPDHGRWLAWNKLGTLEPWDSFSDVEFAWCSWEGAARIFNMTWKGLACDKRGEDGGLRHHTTQKPLRLMRWCIEQAGAGLICDPYMGAGSTGVAAAQLGQPFIGIEIEPHYFDIACRRIEETARQPRLFAELAPKPVVQPSLLEAAPPEASPHQMAQPIREEP